MTELLEGETLRGKLDGSTVTQKQAVDWALQIAKGLSAAHGKGIVHRDLKPDNVFVSSDGHVKILDFGLAKRVDARPAEQTNAPTGTGGGHTEPGTVMGTMGYMSPEQVRGLPVDHRTDIFSFGAILYELLSGKKAFKRDTASDTIAAIFEGGAAGADAVGPQRLACARPHRAALSREGSREPLPDRQRRGVRAVGGLAPDDRRHERAARRPACSAPRRREEDPVHRRVRRRPRRRRAASSRNARNPAPSAGASAKLGVRRVAVLPFENLGSPEDDYFAEGIADAIRGKLTSLPGLEVIARGSSTPYKKTSKTPQEIARELDANYLLTATVRWQKGAGGSRVQVTPELVEVRDSGAPTSRWQQPFDAAITDVFGVQSEIATKVAQALGSALGEGEEKRLSEKPTQNLAAYEAFLKGEVIWNSADLDPASLRKQIAFYEQAVALDPGFAQAWARVSSATSLLYANTAPTPALAQRALQAGEKAVALAPNRPEGYLALGAYQRLVALDPARALEQYQKGLRLAPGDTSILRGAALVEEALGHWDVAVEHLKQALRLDPRDVAAMRNLGDALLRLRRYPEAREAFDRALALAPANLNLIEAKAMTYLSEGDLAGARAVLKAAPKELEPTALVAYLANYYDLVWVLDEGQRDLLRR